MQMHQENIVGKFINHARKDEKNVKIDVMCKLCFETVDSVEGNIDSKFNLGIQVQNEKDF